MGRNTEYGQCLERSNDILKKFHLVEKETGEIYEKEMVSGAIANLLLDDEVIKKRGNSTYRNIKNSNDYINDNLGYYFHLLYGDILNLNLEPQMLVRFLYLCSYMNYENVLVSGNTSGQVKIKESKLQDVLKLNKTKFFETKKYLLENNLITIEDNIIKVSEELVKRGKLKGDIKNMDITRIFNNGVQELYNGVKPIQHKKLAIFIKILPYINIKYNVICENPLETDIEKIKPMTWTELGRMIGLSEATTKRLRTFIWSLKINNSITIGEFSTLLCGKAIIINPRVYYKGNNIESLKGISEMFKIIK